MTIKLLVLKNLLLKCHFKFCSATWERRLHQYDSNAWNGMQSFSRIAGLYSIPTVCL